MMLTAPMKLLAVVVAVLCVKCDISVSHEDTKGDDPAPAKSEGRQRESRPSPEPEEDWWDHFHGTS